MNEPNRTGQSLWRHAVLAATLAVVVIGGWTVINREPCAIVRAMRSLLPSPWPTLAEDPEALAAYCAWHPVYTVTGPFSLAILYHVLCDRPVCPLEIPVTSHPPVPGTFVTPSAAPLSGRLWRISVE